MSYFCRSRPVCMNSVLPLAVLIFMPFPFMLVFYLFATACSCSLNALSLRRHPHEQKFLGAPLGSVSLMHLSINIMDKSGDNTSPCRTPSSIWNQSVSIWPFLTLLTYLLYMLCITLIFFYYTIRWF